MFEISLHLLVTLLEKVSVTVWPWLRLGWVWMWMRINPCFSTVCDTSKKYSQQYNFFFTDDKLVELLLFSIWLFETRRTFLNVSIVDAKKVTSLWVFLNNIIFSDVPSVIVIDLTTVIDIFYLWSNYLRDVGIIRRATISSGLCCKQL